MEVKKITKKGVGTISYRLPNIPEMMELLGLMGISEKSEMQDGYELLFVGRMMKNMGRFIESVKLKKGEETITDYEEALNHLEFMEIISEVAGKISEKMETTQAKKN